MRRYADAIAEDLLAYMRANPGASMKQLSAGMGRAETTIWMRLHTLIKAGRAWKAGPLHVRRYFADKAQAEAAHAVMTEECKRQREETRRAVNARYNTERAKRRKEERAAMKAAKPPTTPKPKKAGGKKYVRKGRAAPYADIDAKILALAARPEGFQTAELYADYTSSRISERCVHLRHKKQIISARTGHKTVRYFTSQADADQYIAVTPVAITPQQRTKFSTDEADYSRAKITRADPPKDRWAVQIPVSGGQITRDWRDRRLQAVSV